MSCSVDLKAYVLGEADAPTKAACDDHLACCAECRDELAGLRLTHAALTALPQEAIPQRIAFVSDRVFEPRWWQTMWRSGPVMGFSSAVVIAAAIVAHGAALKPADVMPVRPAVAVAASGPTTAEVDRRIEVAVAKAVADVEKRDAVRSAQLLEAAEKKWDLHRRADLVAAQETIHLYQQQVGRMMVAYNTGAGAQ